MRCVSFLALMVGCSAVEQLGESMNQVAGGSSDQAAMEAPSPTVSSVEKKEAADYDDGLADEEAPEAEPPGEATAGMRLGQSVDKLSAGEKRKPPAADRGEAPRTRQWFPESFLWQPIVETGTEGRATLAVTVPDQLTTWRVLALAHTRDGAQAGAVHTFDSKQDLYVDPVIPGWLYAGDRLQLPVQVVNTTGSRVSANLSVAATGALSGSGAGTIALSPGGSGVQRVDLSTNGSGVAGIRATLVGEDDVQRTLRVVPAGKPVDKARGGTLAGPRAFRLAGPAKADPSTQEIAVMVFPGPLAVLQAEVERAGAVDARTAGDAAYGFALATQLDRLAAAINADVDAKMARRLRLVAWQRVVGHTRSPDAGAAVDLLTAMGGVTGHTLAQERARWLTRAVVDAQRADGTWARADSGSFQRMLVQTALAARALPESERGARLRASGAFERYAPRVEDAYTAAVILSTGLVDGTVESRLREVLAKGITKGSDGAHSVAVPSGVTNAWGWRPRRAEMLAWGALASDDAAVRGDLVSELMAGYDAATGFGAGPADVVALAAVSAELQGITAAVDVVLSLGGKDVDRARLDPSQPMSPVVLTAKTGGSSAEIGLRTEGDSPGLAFVATLRSWVPWSASTRTADLEVDVRGADLAVGRTGTVELALSAEQGVALVVEQGLPAGTKVDERALAASGQVASWRVMTDRIQFTTAPFHAAETKDISIPVQPAFTGRFSTAPLKIEIQRGGSEVATHTFEPMTWVVN